MPGTRYRAAALVSSIVLGLVGCGPGTTDKTVENDGKACIFGTGTSPEDGIDAGAASIRVYVNTCLSSSCDTVKSKSCEATLEGDTVSVTSRVTIASEQGACTDDCGGVQVDCEVGMVEAGDFTLTHGGESTAITVPDDGAQCVGEAPFGP